MVSPTCLCKELSIYLMWRLSFRKLNLPHPIGSFLPSVLVIKLAKVRQRDTRSTDSIWATTVQGQGHGCPTSAVTQDPATWRAYRRLNALLLSAKMKFLVFEQEVHTLIFFFFWPYKLCSQSYKALSSTVGPEATGYMAQSRCGSWLLKMWVASYCKIILGSGG